MDWAAAAITLGALVALLRLKAGVLPLLGVCAAAGLAVQWLAR